MQDLVDVPFLFDLRLQGPFQARIDDMPVKRLQRSTSLKEHAPVRCNRLRC